MIVAFYFIFEKKNGYLQDINLQTVSIACYFQLGILYPYIFKILQVAGRKITIIGKTPFEYIQQLLNTFYNSCFVSFFFFLKSQNIDLFVIFYKSSTLVFSFFPSMKGA